MPDDTRETTKLPAFLAIEALARAPVPMVLTNPDLADNPIVYVNRAFERTTGYSAETVTGRNCRFLQGPETDPETVVALRQAVREGSEVTLDILNYRADGSPFWNRLTITPLTGDRDRKTYFLGALTVLKEAPDDSRARSDVALREIHHRVKNHLSMIVGMIRVQARASDAEGEFRTLARRVETLQLLYEELNHPAQAAGGNDARIALGAYLARVANAIAYLDGRRGVRVNVESDAMGVRFEAATRIGLIVSEVMTNALQHAFEGRDAGLVEVRAETLSDGGIRVRICDDGIGLPEGFDWPAEGGLGGRIVTQLIEGLEAKLSVERGVAGTRVTFDVPAKNVY